MREIVPISPKSSSRIIRYILAITCGIIAISLVFPLIWLIIEAVRVDHHRAYELLFSTNTLSVLINSLLLMAGVTIGSIILGVPLAYLTVRTDLPFRRFWSVAVALPLVVPSYVGAFALVSAFGPHGAFHEFLAPFGVDRLPEIYGLSGSIFVITLYTYPYVYLTTRAGFFALDTRLIEAARTLNHSRLSAIRRITIPQLRPSIAAGALLTALYAVSDFGTPAIMRLPVFTRQIYVEYNAFGRDYASLLSIQLIIIVVIVLVLEWLIRPGETVHSDRVETGQQQVPLGRWRWPSMAFPAVVSGFSLIVPVWILLLWLVRSDVGRRPSLAFEWIQAINSFSVAAAAAIVAAIMALPIAYYSATSNSRLAAIYERTTYVGFAVPGVVLGLAIVYFGAGYIPWVYQTIPLLVFAYVIRFIPQAVGSTRASFLQIDPQLVEAARTLGVTKIQAFRRITFPLARSGIVAGSALVFLTTMKELPVTLILRPSGFETIVTQIWRAQETALYQYAAIPALLLLGISGLSMIVLLVQENDNRGL